MKAEIYFLASCVLSAAAYGAPLSKPKNGNISTKGFLRYSYSMWEQKGSGWATYTPNGPAAPLEALRSAASTINTDSLGRCSVIRYRDMDTMEATDRVSCVWFTMNTPPQEIFFDCDAAADICYFVA